MRTGSVALVAAAEDLGLPLITWEGAGVGVAVLVGGWLLSRVVGWITPRVLLWRGRSPSASTIFAGIVILARDKFRVADQIAVRDLSGTVAAGGGGEWS